MAANERLRGQIIETLKRNRDGSHATRSNRESILIKICSDLKAAGYNQVTPKNFGNKHFYILRDYWKKEGKNIGTIKNRFAVLRWFAEKIGKTNTPSNKDLELENRVYSDNSKNKAREIDFSKLENLTIRQQYAIMLQRYFGLRREESLKFNPVYADKSDHIKLKGSWTKGGRPRTIPIINKNQRLILDSVRDLVGNNSLIEKEKTYVQDLNNFTTRFNRAGLKNMHGYRHKYAQERYKTLTGRECPKAGGLTSKQLSPEQKKQDFNARMIISEELGHGREEITVQYLGR
ncbi:integrase domain-containing protein [Francisella philomiragia]|uniref:integrase domain-containing protein n=1 Tax=Francisella philomiragia TaxID=28110 RepID=UPI001906AF10|nr:integrase domain-containing protein [Francisella philomiragia]MBK2297334.1 integrase domain-containing protein [Francisella philomiragia]